MWTLRRAVARGLWNRSGHSQWVESDPVDTSFTYECGEGHEYRIRGSSLKDTRGNSASCAGCATRAIYLPLGESGYSPPSGVVDPTDLHGARRIDPDYRGDKLR